MFLNRVKLDTFRKLFNPVGQGTKGLYRELWSDHADVMLSCILTFGATAVACATYSWYSQPNHDLYRFKDQYIIERGKPIPPN